MDLPTPPSPDRRGFIGASGALAALTLTQAGARTNANERPANNNPRATSGDVAVEPNWDERLTVLVGPKKGQIIGTDEKAIQAAVDYVTRFGGGTVRLLEGTFKLRNAVTLNSHVRLVGSGPETILRKEPMVKTKLVLDSDWFDQEITVADASGIDVGDGLCLRAKNPHNSAATVIKRTVIAKAGNRLKLDRGLRENLWLMGDAYAATLFPLITGEQVHDIYLDNFVLDGNKTQNENLDGNYAGCIFLQDCRDVAIKRITARNNNGDGISWQICHDVTVEECHSHDHTGLGLHPGSGSQRPIMRGNVLRHNQIGLFFCWGVKNGLAERNIIEDNRGEGISVGHRDTDNKIISNSIKRSGRVGILFRAERGKAFAGHRNLIESNTIENTGGANSVAIDVEGETEQLSFVRNVLIEKRAAEKRIGFRFGPQTGEMNLQDNKIDGFAIPIQDQRKTAAQ